MTSLYRPWQPVALTVCLALLSVLSANVAAQTSDSDATSLAIESLADKVANWQYTWDNLYLSQATYADLLEQASSLAGEPVTVVVEVERVREREVLGNVFRIGRAYVALKHREPPEFGNLGTVTYPAQPSAARSQLLAHPVGLRIGTEIDLERASTLQDNDLVMINGRIEQVVVSPPHDFRTLLTVIVTDWKVVETRKVVAARPL